MYARRWVALARDYPRSRRSPGQGIGVTKARAGCGYAFIFMVITLLAFRLLGPAALWLLRVVLETLNNI